LFAAGLEHGHFLLDAFQGLTHFGQGLFAFAHAGFNPGQPFVFDLQLSRLAVLLRDQVVDFPLEVFP